MRLLVSTAHFLSSPLKNSIPTSNKALHCRGLLETNVTSTKKYFTSCGVTHLRDTTSLFFKQSVSRDYTSETFLSGALFMQIISIRGQYITRDVLFSVFRFPVATSRDNHRRYDRAIYSPHSGRFFEFFNSNLVEGLSREISARETCP